MEIKNEKSLENKPQFAFSGARLYDHTTPEFIENSGKTIVLYGDKNDYPDYLTYLFNRCGLHRAIINGKVRFILGQGWTTKQGFNDGKINNFLDNPNPYDSLNEITNKALLDDCIFGGYYLKLMFVQGELQAVFHQPYEQVRIGLDGKYYVSKLWTKNQSTSRNFKSNINKLPEDYKLFEPFNPKNKTGVQLAYFPSYRPEFRGYPLPEYHATIVDIESDIEISNFHLNNVKTGFAAGTILTIKGGIADPTEQAIAERQLKDKFAATNNAGEIVVAWAQLGEDSGIKVDNIRSNDLDKQFEILRKDVQDRIIMGHEVVNGMLFGIKTEGQLGGRSEIDIAWRLLNLNYIEPKQQEVEKEFNWILKSCGYLPILKLKPLKGIGLEISESMLTNSLTREEIRKMIDDELNIGLYGKKIASESAEKVTEAINSLSPLVANKVINSMTPNEIRSLVGLTPEQGGEEIPIETQSTFSSQEFDTKLIGEFSKIGLSANDFEFASDEDVLLKYITDNNIKKIDINKAEKELKIDVAKTLEKLIQKNLVVGNNVGTQEAPKFDIKDIQEPETLIEFETKWRYAWVDPNLANNPSEGIDKSRSFCKKMLALNKLYTKAEIDQLNNDMSEYNTDVWKYRGGWYNAGEVNLPQCRHFWKQEIVRKKK
jgi:hypothetical protein